MGNPADLKPGSMISVQLMAGDFSVGADGTVTYIDGNRVYAFGHRFLAVGATALPFARAEVITLLPNLNTSFKLSTAKEWMGAIYQDRDTAVAGELGKRAAMVPVSIGVSRGGAAGRVLPDADGQRPAAFAAAACRWRSTRPSTPPSAPWAPPASASPARSNSRMRPRPVQLDNMFAADNGSAMQASLSAAIPVAYVMQSGFDALQLKKRGAQHRSLRPEEAADHRRRLRLAARGAARREACGSTSC